MLKGRAPYRTMGRSIDFFDGHFEGSASHPYPSPVPLLEALRAMLPLAALDLRGNRVPEAHAIGGDLRVNLAFQRPCRDS